MLQKEFGKQRAIEVRKRIIMANNYEGSVWGQALPAMAKSSCLAAHQPDVMFILTTLEIPFSDERSAARA